MRRRRAVRVGAAASGIAVVLGCLGAVPAVAAPTEPRPVHVEGQLLPVAESPGVFKVTGGLVGTYKLRSERVIHAWTYWATQIREIEGSESINGCVDQNQNNSCDAGEPSGVLRLSFNRVASFNTGTGRLIDSRGMHQVISGGPLSGGVLRMRDIPVGNSDEIVSTYEGDLQVKETAVEPSRVGG
ncbi:MAG TPA: hypothetical protein VFY56_09700 [Propionibacteriaceae bacterium]|nr:hypothetical protein [Propionibacteriaceae bacterium]